MKKAKVFLTGIAIFALIGGALAYKAQRGDNVLYKPLVPGGACTIRTVVQLTISNVGTPAEYSTAPTLLPCPTKTTFFD